MSYYRKHEEEGGWLVPGLLLLIPGLRIVGGILIFRKLRRRFRLTGKEFWLTLLALVILVGGGLGEITGLIAKLAVPMTLVALAVAVYLWYIRKRDARCKTYASFLTERSGVSLDKLLQALGVDEKQFKRDFEYMQRKQMLPLGAYIDLAQRYIVLTPEGRPAERDEPRSAPQPESEPQADQYELILRRIRSLNDEIADEVVSQKIDRIEAATANIFHLVKQKPEREQEIQTFMEYYLPTTLKLLSQYANLERQIDVTENIRRSKQRIEQMMDKLVLGFDEQLDRLFKSDAIDITNDIKVLEKMMKMDGLN